MIRPKYDPATHFVAQAARAILGSYYEDLVLFFLRLYWHCDQQDLLWRAPSTTPKFVVACITRRSNVLLTLFTSILCYYAALPKEKQPKFFSSAGLTCERIAYLEQHYFITDTALLAQSQEIGDYYLSHHELPQIIIFDELLLHGRALNNLLSQFESRIIDWVQTHSESEIQWDAAQFRQQLLNQVQILVYIQNNDELLLVARYQQRLTSQHIAPLAQVRELSKRFSMLIEVSGQNNVAYSWSLRIPYLSPAAERLQDCQPGQGGFFPRITVLQYNEVIDYLRPYPDTSRPKAICSIRWKHSCLGTAEENNMLMLVPYIIFEKYPLQRLLTLHRRITQDLSDLNLSFLTFFDPYIETNSTFYFRWLSETSELVLNSLVAHSFLKAQGVSGLELSQADLSFLAKNYASFAHRSDQISSQLSTLWQWGEAHCEDGLFETYMDLLLSDSVPIWTSEVPYSEMNPVDLNAPAQSHLVTAVENTIIHIATEAERHAYDKYHSVIPLGDATLSNWGNYYSIRTILEQADNYLHETASVSQFLSLLALIIHQMDLGIVGMNPEYESEGQQVYTVTRAGEQALSIEPMRYQTFIPVLLEIIERCRQYQMDLHEEILRFFSTISDVSAEWAQQLYEFVEKTEKFGGGLASWTVALSIPMHTKLFRRNVERKISDANGVSIEKQMLYLEMYAKF